MNVCYKVKHCQYVSCVASLQYMKLMTAILIWNLHSLVSQSTGTQGGLSTYEFNTEDFPDPYPEEVVSRELLSREGKENGEPWAKGTLWAPLESTETTAESTSEEEK